MVPAGEGTPIQDDLDCVVFVATMADTAPTVDHYFAQPVAYTAGFMDDDLTYADFTDTYTHLDTECPYADCAFQSHTDTSDASTVATKRR